MRFTAFFISSLLFLSCSRKDAITPVPEEPPVDTIQKIKLIQKPVTANLNSASGGFYVALPSNYNQTTERLPLLVFIPGGGQFGNGSIDLPLLLNDGPAQLVDEQKFPTTFSVNGKTTSFIVFTPQFKFYPGPDQVDSCIEYAKANYRVDTTRIYLSGLSIGGIIITNLAAQKPNKFAAIVPLAGIPLDFGSTNKSQQIVSANLPLWMFHSVDDPVFNISWSDQFQSQLLSLNPSIPPKLTKWPNGGHDAWTRALDPGYREGGKNIYEWMLQYHR